MLLVGVELGRAADDVSVNVEAQNFVESSELVFERVDRDEAGISSDIATHVH